MNFCQLHPGCCDNFLNLQQPQPITSAPCDKLSSLQLGSEYTPKVERGERAKSIIADKTVRGMAASGVVNIDI